MLMPCCAILCPVRGSCHAYLLLSVSAAPPLVAYMGHLTVGVHRLHVLQIARPVLSGDREERLRAQGVPASIVASMRTFEEQHLRQKPAPKQSSPSLSPAQPPEPLQGLADSSAVASLHAFEGQQPPQKLPGLSLSPTRPPEPDENKDQGSSSDADQRHVIQCQTRSAAPAGTVDAGIAAAAANYPAASLPSLQSSAHRSSGAVQSSASPPHAASAPDQIEHLQQGTALLGQDHDRLASLCNSAQPEHRNSAIAPEQEGPTADMTFAVASEQKGPTADRRKSDSHNPQTEL